MNIAYLLLSDGTLFEGFVMGAIGKVFGEVVFNTGMGGYTECLTDPSCFGQIVVQTFPFVGNYGVKQSDMMSEKIWANGFVSREICETPSNTTSEQNFHDLMIKQNLVGIQGIDTRRLTSILRENGTQNGVITNDISNIDALVAELKTFKTINALEIISVKNIVEYKNLNAKYNVALIDLGYKQSIINRLTERGCSVDVFPYKTKIDDIININYDGVVLYGGVGTPDEYVDLVENIKILIEKNIPVFGINAGHLFVSAAVGGTVYPLKHGHHGENHPVKNLKKDKVFITNQGHEYAVEYQSISPKSAEITHISMNDKSVEGIKLIQKPVFSVQFNPEAQPGPMDSFYLFDEFVDMMKGNK